VKFEILKSIFRDFKYLCAWYRHSFWIWWPTFYQKFCVLHLLMLITVLNIEISPNPIGSAWWDRGLGSTYKILGSNFIVAIVHL